MSIGIEKVEYKEYSLEKESKAVMKCLTEPLKGKTVMPDTF